MKRLFAALALLLLTALLCGWSALYTAKLCSELAGILERASAACEELDFPRAKRETERFHEAFRSHELFFTLFVRRELLQGLTAYSWQLESFLVKENMQDFLAAADAVAAQLDEISRNACAAI